MRVRATVGDSGTNLSRVKDFNQVVVLDLIRSTGPVGRPALAAATGLTLQTVSNITRRLLEAGVVLDEVPSDERGDGRRRAVLRVNPDAGFSLGVHLVREILVVGVVDLAGAIRGRAERHLEPGEPLPEIMRHLRVLADEAIERAGVPREQLLGAGIGVPGPLDLDKGALLDVLRPAAWNRFPVRDAVADALGMRVLMDNDATAAALGERWRGVGRGSESLIYLYLGHGLGAGLILDGQAYRGRRGNAGELSHLQVDPAGPLCDCGARGCLGLYVSPIGLMREARRVALEAPEGWDIAAPPESPEALAASTDPRYAEVVTRTGEQLAGVVESLTRIIDPELVIVGGPLAPLLGDRYVAAIAARLQQLPQFGGELAPRVELSSIGDDAGVIGAATLVLHDLYAPAVHRLSLSEPHAYAEGRAA
jgi:predicted NBD/HSP70 family sugar kinase